MQPTIVQLGVVVSLVALGYAVDRGLAAREPLYEVPSLLRTVVVGLAAVAPILLVETGLPAGAFGFDELVVGLALSLASYTLAGRVLGVAATDCSATASVRG